MKEVVSPTQGLIGFLHEVECKDADSALVFQLPRETKMLSETYVKGAMDSVKKMLPQGRAALVIGCDVNIYELAGADALLLKVKGLI
jgi:hypothetical protein